MNSPQLLISCFNVETGDGNSFVLSLKDFRRARQVVRNTTGTAEFRRDAFAGLVLDAVSRKFTDEELPLLALAGAYYTVEHPDPAERRAARAALDGLLLRYGQAIVRIRADLEAGQAFASVGGPDEPSEVIH